MKQVLIICVILLLLGLLNLPIGYYTILRITITIGAITVIVNEFENGLNFWLISFGIITIIFNPIIPVYLNNKSAWIPIDILVAFLFGFKLITLYKK